MPTSPLLDCAACGGLSPAGATACLHCDAALARRRFGFVARAIAAGGAMVTLMACYGMVARPYPVASGDCQGDQDHDGVCAPRDCDDTRPDVYPGAADVDGDGVDSNCDGVDGWRDDTATVVTPAATPTAPP